MSVKIAVVNSKSFGKYSDVLERLKRVGQVDFIEVPRDIDGAELGKRLEGYHFVVASVTPYYSRRFFESNSSVVMIVRHGIGVDNIDLRAAEEFGVYVARVPGWREREAVAEHTIALMLAALRYVVQAHEAVKAGKWGERARFVGRELKNLTVGVVGFGNIGSRVAEILVKGFGSRVLVFDPYVPAERIREAGCTPVDLDTLLRESDIITLHAALTSENYHMLNEAAFEKMKRGVIIVDTARGELIDTQALVKYLENGKIGAVALDVVEGEPIGADHPLLKYPNVIITPHIAAYTYEALKGMDDAVVEAIESYLSGRPIDGLVVEPKKPRRLKI